MNTAQVTLAECARELVAAKFHQENAAAALRRAAAAAERMGAAWEDSQPLLRDLTTSTNIATGVLHAVLRAADLTPSEAGIDL